LTPLHAYSQTLLVTGTFGDGTQSETRRYGFYANQITPQPQPSLASTEPKKATSIGIVRLCNAKSVR
jgi:hypothetical protein